MEGWRTPRSRGSTYADGDMKVGAKPDAQIARLDLRTEPVPCPLPPPEKVFADWLLWVPRNADLCAAAREQIALIDRCGSHHPDLQFLRTLLAAVAGGSRDRAP